MNVGNSVSGDALLDWTSGPSTARIYGSNEHGDVTWVGSSSGSVSGTLRYDPWGNTVGSSGSMPDWRWQGSWADSVTSLLHTQSRWYSPVLGRFASEDQQPGSLVAPANRNLYAYGAGNPIDHADQSGAFWKLVKPGNTLGGLAASWLGGTANWPGIFNFNRARIANPNLIHAGWCLYIPRWEFFGIASGPKSDCGSSNPRLPVTVTPARSVMDWAFTSSRTLGVRWYNIYQYSIDTLTDRDVGFSRHPSLVDRFIYALHESEGNAIGSALAALPPSASIWNYWDLPVILVLRNPVFPSANEAQETVGAYIFSRDYPRADQLVHEYIHVLQYQAMPNFIEQYLRIGVLRGRTSCLANPAWQLLAELVTHQPPGGHRILVAVLRPYLLELRLRTVGLPRAVGLLAMTRVARNILICTALALSSLLGCEQPGGGHVIGIVVDNQSSGSIVLIVGQMDSGLAYLMPAGHKSNTGVAETSDQSVPLEILDAHDCHVMATFDMAPPARWLLTITASGSATVSSRNYQDIDLSLVPVPPATDCLVGRTPSV